MGGGERRLDVSAMSLVDTVEACSRKNLLYSTWRENTIVSTCNTMVVVCKPDFVLGW